jgi:hypothetical protein
MCGAFRQSMICGKRQDRDPAKSGFRKAQQALSLRKILG